MLPSYLDVTRRASKEVPEIVKEIQIRTELEELVPAFMVNGRMLWQITNQKTHIAKLQEYRPMKGDYLLEVSSSDHLMVRRLLGRNGTTYTWDTPIEADIDHNRHIICGR